MMDVEGMEFKDCMIDGDTRIELINGRIADVENGCYYGKDVRIIIQNGKIMSMPGDIGEQSKIKGDLVVDLKGKAVIPGLFNTHSHVQWFTMPMLTGEAKDKQVLREMEDCLKHGVTNIRDALTDSLHLNRDLKEKIEKGEIKGPRIHQAIYISPIGGTFAPYNGKIKKMLLSLLNMKPMDYNSSDSGAVVFSPSASEQDVKDAVDRAIDERGAEFIKIYDQTEKGITYKPGAQIMTEQQLESAINQAQRRGVKTMIHQLTLNSFRRGIKAGVSSLAHIPYDDLLNEKDIKDFLESGCIIEPTLSVLYHLCWNTPKNNLKENIHYDRLVKFRNETYKSLANEFWAPEFKDKFILQFDDLSKGKMKMLGIIDISYIFNYYAKWLSNGIRNMKMLFENGTDIRFACGNDACVGACSISAVKHELDMFNFCLNEAECNDSFNGKQALKVATINSARMLGLENDFGSISPGKVADLAIVDGDPFADYRIIGAPVSALFLNGKLLINNCGLELSSRE